MTKLELLVSVLYGQMADPDKLEMDKKAELAEGIKGFACDALNQLHFFKEKNVPPEVIKELVSPSGNQSRSEDK
jgi:hypothetical protein